MLIPLGTNSAGVETDGDGVRNASQMCMEGETNRHI